MFVADKESGVARILHQVAPAMIRDVVASADLFAFPALNKRYEKRSISLELPTKSISGIDDEKKDFINESCSAFIHHCRKVVYSHDAAKATFKKPFSETT